jgi:hypothetical protein
MKYIYCRGGDKTAPEIARSANMLYGIRYDYPAYDKVYMLDAGLSPKWITYKKKVKKLRPTFALVPDFEHWRDISTIQLYIDDLRRLGVSLIGVTPKFYGALSQLPNDEDIVICISIPSTYSGYLPEDAELRPGARYHLLGGDIREQINEIRRIKKYGGDVISLDGNKLARKAAYGQIFQDGHWVKVNNTTKNNAIISAKNIMEAINNFSENNK